MKNLSGDRSCDKTIEQELRKAGIQIVQHSNPAAREVPASVTGQLTLNSQTVFTFTRAWCYWVVYGQVPLGVAQEMYNNEVGRQSIRVAGYAGNDKPENWAFPKDEVVAEYLRQHNIGFVTNGELARLCNSGEITGDRFVVTYHIDTQQGLDLFVETIRKHGLAEGRTTESAT